MTLQEKIERLLVKHKCGWCGNSGYENHPGWTSRCCCGWQENHLERFNATGAHRVHVAAEIVKLLKEEAVDAK